ncbi:MULTISPECIES: transcriptional regulator [Yersinia]|uniref:transcriptional regulator n=1 Tax=Yersinia TaxID=629 RepID=UPI0011A02046|nr:MULTISPECIES: YdaS family helix-turn-helix protein [Yersinia]
MNINTQQKIFSIVSQSELARRLGKKSQTVSFWFKNGVPAKEVMNAARALNWAVTPHELRPDLYPNPTDGIPPELQSNAPAA